MLDSTRSKWNIPSPPNGGPFGEVAKWLGNGLQNRYTRVRIPSSPPNGDDCGGLREAVRLGRAIGPCDWAVRLGRAIGVPREPWGGPETVGRTPRAWSVAMCRTSTSLIAAGDQLEAKGPEVCVE